MARYWWVSPGPVEAQGCGADDDDNGHSGGSVARADLETGTITELAPAAVRPTFVPPDRIVYARPVPEGYALSGSG